MNPQFEIEGIFNITDRETTIVCGRLLTKESFRLTEKSTLGGILIEKWIDMPRAHDENGIIRRDLFAFKLKNKDDKEKISIGQIVDLLNTDLLK